MFNKSAAVLALLIASGNLEATSGFQVVTPNVSTRLIANIQTQTCNAFREPFSLHATRETMNERSVVLGVMVEWECENSHFSPSMNIISLQHFI